MVKIPLIWSSDLCSDILWSVLLLIVVQMQWLRHIILVILIQQFNIYFCIPFLASDQRTIEKKYPTDVRSSLFVQTFVACAASTVDPVILVRLLANRLVTTPLYPRNSSSITSMSGQDPFPPRTTRSRASSTDTNASTRRKRVSYNNIIIY